MCISERVEVLRTYHNQEQTRGHLEMPNLSKLESGVDKNPAMKSHRAEMMVAWNNNIVI